MITLEVGSIVIPTEAALEFEQDYEEITAQTIERTAAGGGILRRLYGGKLRSLVTGKGWVPAAFINLDTGAAHVIKCAAPLEVSSANTTVTLPAGRRSDAGHEPIGFGLVGDRLVATTISNLAAILAGTSDDASLVAVPGAIGYRVVYHPQITALILSHRCKGASSGNYDFRLEVEQV